jgi:hypothetical protein
MIRVFKNSDNPFFSILIPSMISRQIVKLEKKL